MTLSYTLNDNAPTAIFPQAQQGTLTIYNQGPSTVYLDAGSSVNTQSTQLPPLSNIEWASGQPLFAKCDTGSATITVDLQGRFLDTSRSAYMLDILTVGTLTNSTDEFECGSYESLVIFGTVDPPFVPNPIVKGFTVYWYDPNGHFLNYENITFWCGDSGPQFNCVIPVKGFRAQVILDTNVSANTISNLRIAGSTRKVNTSILTTQSRVWYATNQTLAVESFHRDTFAMSPWDGITPIYFPAISNHMQIAVDFDCTNAGFHDIVEGINFNIYGSFSYGVGLGTGRVEFFAPTSIPLLIRPSPIDPPAFNSISITATWENV